MSTFLAGVPLCCCEGATTCQCVRLRNLFHYSTNCQTRRKKAALAHRRFALRLAEQGAPAAFDHAASAFLLPLQPTSHLTGRSFSLGSDTTRPLERCDASTTSQASESAWRHPFRQVSRHIQGRQKQTNAHHVGKDCARDDNTRETNMIRGTSLPLRLGVTKHHRWPFAVRTTHRKKLPSVSWTSTSEISFLALESHLRHGFQTSLRCEHLSAHNLQKCEIRRYKQNHESGPLLFVWVQSVPHLAV